MLKKIGTVLLLTVMTLAMLLPQQQQVEASSKVYVQSQVNGLNVRSAGSLNGKVIGKINKGQQLQRTGSKGAWIRVNYKGKAGWIAAKYLKSVKKATKSVTKTSLKAKTYKMNASAYTPYCKGCSGVTALGWNVRAQKRNVIAVDPRVIPLGKKVQVYVGGKLMGTYTAADAGGAIKGNKIDILMYSQSAALNFGRKTVTVKVL
ncbi:3D domain-containing protein [Exiguobacterium sp. s6]|uniref:3D domain-containing protein n=1 Tax=Exiguobacterium sp. s6 TaxID=2751236 RepID=UPI001BE731E6|nr:3D domain-containing protein [Exiguobacterium sp. s6]